MKKLLTIGTFLTCLGPFSTTMAFSADTAIHPKNPKLESASEDPLPKAESSLEDSLLCRVEITETKKQPLCITTASAVCGCEPAPGSLLSASPIA
jgi:hypothetical protein